MDESFDCSSKNGDETNQGLIPPRAPKRASRSVFDSSDAEETLFEFLRMHKTGDSIQAMTPRGGPAPKKANLDCATIGDEDQTVFNISVQYNQDLKDEKESNSLVPLGDPSVDLSFVGGNTPKLAEGDVSIRGTERSVQNEQTLTTAQETIDKSLIRQFEESSRFPIDNTSVGPTTVVIGSEKSMERECISMSPIASSSVKLVQPVVESASIILSSSIVPNANGTITISDNTDTATVDPFASRFSAFSSRIQQSIEYEVAVGKEDLDRLSQKLYSFYHCSVQENADVQKRWPCLVVSDDTAEAFGDYIRSLVEVVSRISEEKSRADYEHLLKAERQKAEDELWIQHYMAEEAIRAERQKTEYELWAERQKAEHEIQAERQNAENEFRVQQYMAEEAIQAEHLAAAYTIYHEQERAAQEKIEAEHYMEEMIQAESEMLHTRIGQLEMDKKHSEARGAELTAELKRCYTLLDAADSLENELIKYKAKYYEVCSSMK